MIDNDLRQTFAALSRKAWGYMTVPVDNPQLLIAQYKAFTKQVPLLYFILLTNTWSTAFSFFDDAPLWLSVGLPGLLTLICGVRIVSWWQGRRLPADVQRATAALKRLGYMSIFLAIAFGAWALELARFGDALQQSRVAFYMAITVIGCIFCLMQVRGAAVTVALIVNTIFVVFFGLSGNPIFMATALNLVLVSGAMLVILSVSYRDFTQMVAAQSSTLRLSEENLRLANLDMLTELPNRRSFFSSLDTAVAEAEQTKARFAVGIMDLDGFKPINDLFGHGAGDKLLIEVGRRLAGFCAGRASLARLGGDEFAVIVAHPGSTEALASFGEALCRELTVPFLLEEGIVRVSASIGFAVFPETATDAKLLFERADYALYHGKRTDKGGAVLFSASHEAAIHKDLRLERELREADLGQELSVVFQPIVDIRGGRVVAFEALARWQSHVLGAVSPADFIPAAERTGMVNRLTCILLRKALASAQNWPKDIRLSFNLSAKDMCGPESILRITSVIMRSGFDPRRLDFEITETAVMHDYAQASTAIQPLKALGVGISLDDFGTGYSSLSQLHALPLTKIKVDRSFVTELHLKPASYKIVKSLLALSRDMDVDCIVEGVETGAEFEALVDLGCVYAQGYLFARPLNEQAVLEFIATSGHTPTQSSFRGSELQLN